MVGYFAWVQFSHFNADGWAGELPPPDPEQAVIEAAKKIARTTVAGFLNSAP